MRYYIIFGITFILAGIIYFYNPYEKYLSVYKEKLTIEYDYDDEGYEWIYDNNDILNIKKISDSKWELTKNKEGKSVITFYYTNTETNDTKYVIYYEFEVKKNKIYWTVGNASGLLDYPNPY